MHFALRQRWGGPCAVTREVLGKIWQSVFWLNTPCAGLVWSAPIARREHQVRWLWLNNNLMHWICTIQVIAFEPGTLPGPMPLPIKLTDKLNIYWDRSIFWKTSCNAKRNCMLTNASNDCSMLNCTIAKLQLLCTNAIRNLIKQITLLVLLIGLEPEER